MELGRAWWMVLLLTACGGHGGDSEDTQGPDDTDATDTDTDGCENPVAWYRDADGDGVGAASDTTSACEQPAGYVATAGDCNDGDASAFPGGVEACGDGVDEDCSGADALCSASADGWSITAGEITSGGTSDTITSTFTLTREDGADARTGGACLIADLVDRGIGPATCTSDTDCAVDSDHAALGWYGYCGHPEGSGEADRCWTRPGTTATHCLRSIDVEAKSFPPGTYDLPVVPGDPLGDGQPTRWSVLACLALEAYPAGCGSGDPTQYVRVFGPVFTYTP